MWCGLITNGIDIVVPCGHAEIRYRSLGISVVEAVVGSEGAFWDTDNVGRFPRETCPGTSTVASPGGLMNLGVGRHVGSSAKTGQFDLVRRPRRIVSTDTVNGGVPICCWDSVLMCPFHCGSRGDGDSMVLESLCVNHCCSKHLIFK